MVQRVKHYDAIVVGVGGMGSAATHHLARRGRNVLSLERHDIPHSKGSSHGKTRIIRKAGYTDPAYTSLLERAYELWRDLDDSAEHDLFHDTGYVAAGPEDGDVFTAALESCRENDYDHEVLMGGEISERYPGFDLPAEFKAVVDPTGGFLYVEGCIVAHVRAAHRHGADIRAREPVLDWSPTRSGGVRVETNKAAYTADRLVVTAGAWASELLPMLKTTAIPERQVLGWFQPDQPDRFTSDKFPVFSLDGEEGGFYGFPIYQVPGFKLGKHNHFYETVDPDEVGEPTRADERILRTFAERYFPDGAGPTMTLETCLFTNSPDEGFIIDRHPEHSQVIVAAGLSGHGFKMSAAVGELLADLTVEDGDSRPPDSFRIDRF